MPASRSINVLYAREPPDAFYNCREFPHLKPNLRCPFPGWTVEVLNSLIQGMGMHMVPTVINDPPDSTDFGMKMDNNTWTGVLGMIQNGSVDIACLSFQRTTARQDSFDYSYPLTNFQPQFVAKKIRLEIASGIADNFKPFDWFVWASLLAVLVAFMVIFPLMAFCEHKMGMRPKEETYEMMWNTIAGQLLMFPESLYFRTLGGKLALLTFSLLSAGVIMWSYEGFVIFSMLGPDKPFPFTESEMFRLISKKSITLVTKGNGFWMGAFIKEAHGEFFDKLRHALVSNPVVFADSTEIKRLVDTGRYVFLTSEDDGAMLKIRQLCDVVSNSMGLGQVTTHLILQRGSRLTDLFNKEIIRQQSFIQRTQRKYFDSGFRLDKATKCVGQQNNVDPFERAMSFYDFLGIITLLGYGLAAGVVVFILELLVRRIQDYQKSRLSETVNQLKDI